MEMEDPLDDMSRFVRGPLTGLAINDEIWTVSLLNLNQWKPNDTNIDRDVHSAVVFEGRGNINKVMDEKYNILAAPEPFGFGPPPSGGRRRTGGGLRPPLRSRGPIAFLA